MNLFFLIPLQFRKRPDKSGPSRDQVTAQVLNFYQEPRKSSEIMELNGKSAILQKSATLQPEFQRGHVCNRE
jgi:hypothetical protein